MTKEYRWLSLNVLILFLNYWQVHENLYWIDFFYRTKDWFIFVWKRILIYCQFVYSTFRQRNVEQRKAMWTRRPRWLGKKKDFHFDKAASSVNGNWQEGVPFIEKITVERAAGFIKQLKQSHRVSASLSQENNFLTYKHCIFQIRCKL